jgi:hypothetical protein
MAEREQEKKLEIEFNPHGISDLRFTIDTLEIERSRLMKAIRKMRSLPKTEDEYPLSRIRENEAQLAEIETSIVLLRACVRSAIESRQREHAEWDERRRKTEQEYKKRLKPPKAPDDESEAPGGESKPE